MSRSSLVTAPAAPPLDKAWEADLGDHVVKAAWSPDGSKLAVACIGGPVSVFGRDGQFHYEAPGHRSGTMSLSWCSDSTRFATGGQDSIVRIWDAASGSLLHELDAGKHWVEQVSFSPLRDYLATGCGRVLKLWNGAGDAVRTYPPHPSTITDIQWQPRDLFFATSSYGQLATFHPNADEPVKQFSWKGSILVIAWSPDGNYVATGNQDASVHFWYRKSGRDLEMTGYPAKIRELSWDAQSRFLATGGSPVVTIWDCSGKGPAGTRPIQLEGHGNRLLGAIAYQNKGSLLASGCKDGRICLWQPHKSTSVFRQSELGGAITQLAWAPDDKRLSAATATGFVRVFQPTW